MRKTQPETAGSSFYAARVMHHRLKPVSHRFVHRVFSLLVDIDRLDELSRRLRLFSLNRFNLFSFAEKDFGDLSGAPLRHWVERILRAEGHDYALGRVRLLCFPRLLGYAFNPISVFYCEDSQGTLRTVIYQVRNTYHERHSYLIPLEGDDMSPESDIHRHEADKQFYVSPFIDLEARYRFRLRAPGERLSLLIAEDDAEGPLLFASLTGNRRKLSDWTLIRAFFAVPLMTFKVFAAIHWHALRLWLKKVRVFRHEPPPAHAVTAIRRAEDTDAGERDTDAIFKGRAVAG